MFKDVPGIWWGVLACGIVDLRKGIDGLAMIFWVKYRQNPFEKGTLFYSAVSGKTESRDFCGWVSVKSDVYDIIVMD